jgi:hypothetical protein
MPVFLMVYEKYPKIIHFVNWFCFSSLPDRIVKYALRRVGQKGLFSITEAEKRNSYNSGSNCFE